MVLFAVWRRLLAGVHGGWDSFSLFPMDLGELGALEAGAESREYVQCPTALSAYQADQTCQYIAPGWRLSSITTAFENGEWQIA
ncbi:MAG: hypothetical protein IPH72_25005 [Sandaracinaceae bacterium]|nr:hypothetical protein [Sandaracinaceae bacterium]